ncbi:DUF5107 domain-containing protein [Segetibacter koreensis]|uniref:DUF5107 domain-containing protein n=1 Tax=Segetibacter koreensis TaxID=398037 RepID=UPI000360C659|nr:DUF5107 domain-containing protein [Segetibacter koreensis]
MISNSTKDGIEILTTENDQLFCSIAPSLGGKITSLYNKSIDREFLWTNENLSLKIHSLGADYDSNFFGAIDELIPNDIPETVDSITYPDHGELWTTVLQSKVEDEKITVFGRLPLSGLFYSKTVYLDSNKPILYLDYKIRNESDVKRNFLWKLHAALKIKPGDKLETGAKNGKVVDPEYSRFTQFDEFAWPLIENKDASIIPAKSNTMDFFYLYGMPKGEMQLLSNDEKYLFSYSYDLKVFPYQWYFASYGGFFDHYTAILEPCTNMPISVNDALAKHQSAVLEPGEELTTTVRIYAGEKTNYIP